MDKSKIGTNAGKIMKRLEGELTDTITKKSKRNVTFSSPIFTLRLAGWHATIK
jgi:hypothetical protein